MELSQLLLITVFVAFGAMTQGSLGIGLTLVAGPVVLAIEPAFAPAPLMVAGQVIGLRHVMVDFSHIDRGTFKRATIGMPLGLALGLVVLSLMSEKALSISIGLATAAAAAALLTGLRVTNTPRVDAMGGAGIAFCSVTAALPGPPAVIAFSSMVAATMRATVAAMIIVIAAASSVGLAFTGRFGRRELELLAILMPGVLLGLVAARYVRPHIDRQWFRPAVLVFALIGGLALAARSAMA